MESIERKIENYAVVFNVNLIRATLNEASEFKNYLAKAIQETDKDLIINLSACEHLDSTFLGVLVSGYKRLKSQNRTLVIIEPIDQSSIFLTLNSIGKIFPLYTSVKVALEDIENKKLLEKEINELKSEHTRPIEKPAYVSYKIANQQLTDDKIESSQEETHKNKTETILTKDFKELSEGAHKVKSEIKAQKWNQVELNHAETELAIHSHYIPEESVADEKESVFESIEAEESPVIIKRSRKTEKAHFGGSSIQWEFGFSS